ncbi:unnamed protein product [Enterobius vermicularis]|uniref:G_PROTEIN_RECEP_F1_2 domain-containing protein n=1 Tax=Enterobius vermicularis TaxID=51028 RepID=A0A0N4VR98_ENTVE|nr:unnamed protein product [Enterobius vermicularis]
MAVLNPLHSGGKLTKKVRVNMTICIWMFAFLFNLPYFFTAKLAYFFFSKNFSRHWVTISFVFWYCIPLITMGYIYAKIGMVLWHSASGNVVIITDVESDAEIPHLRSGVYGRNFTSQSDATARRRTEASIIGNVRKTSRNETVETRRKVIRLLIAIVLSFAILTLPHHIRLVYLVCLLFNQYPVICIASFYFYVQPITYLLLFLSSCTNPFLYAFFSSKFRSATYDVLCRYISQLIKF